MLIENKIEEILDKEKFLITGFKGNSMKPVLRKNDRLLILKTNRELKLYDIVCYKTKDKYILHRIIGINDNEYQIRGDNTLEIEDVNKDKVLGYLDTIYRGSKEIKVTEEMNLKDYNNSIKTLPIRKLKRKIKSLLK